MAADTTVPKGLKAPHKSVLASLKQKPILWIGGIVLIAAIVVFVVYRKENAKVATAQLQASNSSDTSSNDAPGYFTDGTGDNSDMPATYGSGGGGGGGGGDGSGASTPAGTGSPVADPDTPTTGGGAPTAAPVHHAVAAASQAAAPAFSPVSTVFVPGVGNTGGIFSTAGIAAVRKDITTEAPSKAVAISPNAKTQAAPKAGKNKDTGGPQKIKGLK